MYTCTHTLEIENRLHVKQIFFFILPVVLKPRSQLKNYKTKNVKFTAHSFLTKSIAL